MVRSGIVTLTTDFGPGSAYAGVLKGVIWGIFPQARIADLTHEVHPQDVLQGAFLLASTYRYFPPGTVHLAVVDPGVGTERPALAVEAEGSLFVAPDNGLLSGVWAELDERGQANARIVELDQARYWLPEVSRTFHGRDLFAPVAAHLAAGVPLEEAGSPRRAMVLLQGVRPQVRADGTIEGRIVQVDRFGNCISNIAGDRVAGRGEGNGPWIEVAGRRLEGLSRTYGEGQAGQLLALVGSSGQLEIAVRGASAATELGIVIGEPIRVRTTACCGTAD